MNKQELIEKIGNLDKLYGEKFYVALDDVLDLVKQLDEPQKVTIPQFVADWIERSKQEKRNLRNALNNGGEKMRLWFLDQENYDLFGRAWLDGYEVEKEKRYRVKIKGTGQYLRKDENSIRFSSLFISDFTKDAIEDLGFGEVFNSPLFEIEEVE